MSQSELEHFLLSHQEHEQKDAAIAFLPGTLRGDRRLKGEVESLSALVLDLDGGSDIVRIRDAIASRGLYAFIYSTHSHMLDGIPKYRLVFPLERPFCSRDHDGIEEFEATWKSKYTSFADSLGLEWDGACLDISRAFYGPSCKPGAPRIAAKFDGAPLNIHMIEGANPRSAHQGSKGTNRRASVEFEGLELVAWLARYGSTFKIEAALRECAPVGIVRSERSGQTGVHIQCPFEDTHSQPDGNGTFVADAAEAGFVIHCCHQHCLTMRGNGTSLDRAVYLQKMLEDGWLTLDALQNTDLGGGPTSCAPRDLRVVDSDGKGIDAAALHRSMVEEPGAFDFEMLSRLCSKPIAPDVTALQLAQSIEAGHITLASLKKSWRGRRQYDDPYRVKLKDLIAAEQKSEISQRDIDLEVVKIKTDFGAKQKTIEADLKKLRRDAQQNTADAALGALSAGETAFVGALRNYAKTFAFINSGGKAMILQLTQPDLSRALMTANDFEMLHRQEWLQIMADGRKLIAHPAREFIAKPPKDVRVYHNGFVFKPSGAVKSTEYNLYRGMRIKPDPSASCSLFHELIREVWAHDILDVYSWIIEHLFHILAYPGEKIGTSIAIRGAYGDGKSIVFNLLKTILGDMLLTVANQNLILGEYNEALIGKLLVVLEEAAFAKDKQAFDRLKELITGDTVVVNPKFKAPIMVDNYSRMFLVSNHDHFLHIQPNDRRYTVLESSSAWRGSDKFQQLSDQWNKGGAERFLYEALNHSFRRFDEGKRLLISRNLKTEAAAHQVAESRSPIDRCIVRFLLTGSFGTAIDWPPSSAEIEEKCWKLDAPLEIPSREIERSVNRYLAEVEGARNGTTLHTIIAHLKMFVGSLDDKRPKGPKDALTGKRPQWPTLRYLPRRRQALEHALAAGLITSEEFAEAVPATPQLTLDEFAAGAGVSEPSHD